MDKKFTPIAEIKQKIDEKNKPSQSEGFNAGSILEKICNYLMSIVIPIIAFIIIINPMTFGKVSGLDDVNLTVNSSLRTTSAFAGLLILGNVLNYFGII